MPGESFGTGRVRCAHPTAIHPFYHLAVKVISQNHEQLKVKRVSVNGKAMLDFFVYHNGRLQKNYVMRSEGSNVVIVRFDWKTDERVKVSITGVVKGTKEEAVVSSSLSAPAQGGYWNEKWPYYTSIVLNETAGLPRVNEPVHTTLAFYSDRVSDPVAELRIVGVDTQTGRTEEVPSQVHSVEQYHYDKPDVRYQPTTVCEVAFSATVEAYGSCVYLAFYGNSKAQPPAYNSTLRKKGSGLGLSMENRYYSIKLSHTRAPSMKSP